MIIIQHSNLEKLVLDHYESYKDFNDFTEIETTEKYKTEKNYTDVTNIFKKEFRDILIAKPKKIEEYISNFSKYNIRFNIVPKGGKLTVAQTDHNNYIEALNKIFNYDKIDKVKFAQDLNLTVCPYCNREYIFKFKENKKTQEIRVLSDLDHFFSRSHYPFLAISFYNLIPSCAICNRKFKTAVNFFNVKHLHPYNDDFNSVAKFHLKITAADFYFSEKAFDIKLVSTKQNDLELLEKITNTIDTFRLDTLYQNHKDIVLELIKKKYLYSDDYIDSLYKQYEGTLFKNKEQLIGIILGNYISDEELGKRPLSKLTRDIAEELGLI